MPHSMASNPSDLGDYASASNGAASLPTSRHQRLSADEPHPLKASILVVDDELDALNLVRQYLSAAGFRVLECRDGETALNITRAEKPHLIILDLWLPGMTGLDVCRALKSDRLTAQIPVVMLTADQNEIDRVVAFELGVDDYVTKPFSPRELVLRTQAILRRRFEAPPAPRSLSSGDITVDFDQHLVTVCDEPIDLTAIEFKLLAFLLERRGRVQSRNTLVGMIWDADHAIELRTVDTHLRRLREKLGRAGNQISTIRGFGYRLDDVPEGLNSKPT